MGCREISGKIFYYCFKVSSLIGHLRKRRNKNYYVIREKKMLIGIHLPKDLNPQ